MDQIANTWSGVYSACVNAKNGNAAWLSPDDIAFIASIETRVEGDERPPRSSDVQRLTEVWAKSPQEVEEMAEAFADGSAFDDSGTPVLGETPDKANAPEPVPDPETGEMPNDTPTQGV